MDDLCVCVYVQIMKRWTRQNGGESAEGESQEKKEMKISDESK